MRIGNIATTQIQGGYKMPAVLTKHTKRELIDRHQKLVNGEVTQERHTSCPALAESVRSISVRAHGARYHITCISTTRHDIIYLVCFNHLLG